MYTHKYDRTDEMVRKIWPGREDVLLKDVREGSGNLTCGGETRFERAKISR